MTDKPARTKNMNGPLDPFTAAGRIVRLIADEPDAAAIETEVRAEIAKRIADSKTKRQAGIRAIVARVAEKDRDTMERAVLSGPGLCGFDLGVGANDDCDTGSGGVPPDEIPARLREPLSAERLAVAKGGGR